jgi:hypothetical protein
MISVVGCSKNTPEKKPSASEGQKPKAPSQLKSMATELDMLISELDKKFKMEKMPAMQQNIQLNPQGKSQSGQTQGGQSQSTQSQGTQSQSGNSQNEQSQGTQSKNGESQSGQSQGSQSQNGDSKSTQSQGTQTQSGQSQSEQTQKQTTDWQKEFNSLKTIHTNWNSLMPEAVEAGMSIDSRNQFSKSLEQLTQDISKQKLEDSISALLMLYKNYADLTKLFTSSVPAEFYQVKYEIMAAIFESSRKNWTVAEEHAPKIKERWVHLSAQAKESDPKIINRTEFAVLDLEQAIKSKQMELVMIKGEIAMTNLKSLEEKLSSQPSS